MNRHEVDQRILELETKVNKLTATVEGTELALRLIDYDVEEEGLTCTIAKLRREAHLYTPPTKDERDDQKREVVRLRRELGLQQKELAETLAAKNAADAVALQEASDMIQKWRTEGKDSEVLQAVSAAVAVVMEQKLLLRPVRPKSTHFYALLPPRTSQTAEGEEEKPPAQAIILRHVGNSGEVNIALVTVYFDEESHFLMLKGAASDGCMLVIQCNGAAYKGPMSQRCEPDGDEGEATYPDGSSYRGRWQLGVRDGPDAHVVLANGDVYDGEYRADCMTGVGRRVYEDSVYEGDFVDGARHGHGTFTKDATRYDGEWVDDRQHGHGTLDDAENGLVYTGDFAEGVRHGHGTLAAADGRGYYEGPWAADLKHGDQDAAVHFTAAGVRYDGKWKKGVRRGQATAFTAE